MMVAFIWFGKGIYSLEFGLFYKEYLDLRIDLIKLNIHIRFNGKWSVGYCPKIFKFIFGKDPVTGEKVKRI